MDNTKKQKMAIQRLADYYWYPNFDFNNIEIGFKFVNLLQGESNRKIIKKATRKHVYR